jgi:hypothetical protein
VRPDPFPFPLIEPSMSTDPIQPNATFTPVLVAPQPVPATMTIASDDTESGYIIINAADFDAETMTPYVAPTEGEAPKRRTPKGE